MRRARARRGRRGFTLIELSIAISLLMIGMVTVVSATSRMHNLRRQNRERVLAQNAIRSITERIHAQSFSLRNTGSTVDWAQNLTTLLGPGGDFGNTFDVTGLAPAVVGQPVGTITVVTDETATDAALGFLVGMPRDLNGDGDATDADVSNDARVLPVIVQLVWRQGSTGSNQLTHTFYVMGY